MKERNSHSLERILLFVPSIVLIVIAFLITDPVSLFQGYSAILMSPSVLISDYLFVGGLGATLFNVATVLLFNVILLRWLKLDLTGPIFAGLLTIAGFAFFGKNLLNTIPIYLGTYVYALIRKLDFKSLIIVMLFSTGIAPIVSFLIFGTGWPMYFGIPAGIVVGILTGFLLPAISQNTLKFHQGYNLYNVGFAMGIVSTMYAAILKGFGINLNVGGPSNPAFHTELLILGFVLSLLFVVGALLIDARVVRTYPNLMKSTGRLSSDFMTDYGIAAAFFNVGVMGFICLLVIGILGFQITGPLMGGILTVMGFAAFGKHPLNSLPVMFGAYLAVIVSGYSFESVGIVIAILFVTALAPIAGRYGIVAGVVAGFIHLLIGPLCLAFQGGFDLYNNGFTAGFVAALMIPILEFLFKEKKPKKLRMTK